MPRKYVDLDLNFIPNPVTGDISMNVGDMAVIRSIENLAQLNQFDIPFHPEISTNITYLLFEIPSTATSTLLEKEIKNAIENFEPRATVNYINVDADLDNNRYMVTISVFIDNNPDPVTITAFLDRVT